MGPAIARDLLQFAPSARFGGPLAAALSQAVELYVLPQLDGLGASQVESVHQHIVTTLSGDTARLTARLRLLHPRATLPDAP